MLHKFVNEYECGQYFVVFIDYNIDFTRFLYHIICHTCLYDYKTIALLKISQCIKERTLNLFLIEPNQAETQWLFNLARIQPVLHKHLQVVSSPLSRI